MSLNNFEKYFDSTPPLNKLQTEEWIRHGIYHDTSKTDNILGSFLTPDSRYICGISQESIQFTDLFNGHKRSFDIPYEVDATYPQFLSVIRLLPNRRFLIKHGRYKYLIQLKFNENDGLSLNTLQLPSNIYNYFTVDESNDHRFITSHGSKAFLFSSENGEFPVQRIDIWSYNCCLRLDGNLLCGMDQPTYAYWKMNLITEEKTKKFNFSVQDHFKTVYPRQCKEYLWFDANTCYVLNNNNVFLKFDVELRSCVEIKLLKHTQIRYFSFLNENQLICQSYNNFFYKFQLRKPNQLMNITYFQMRRYKLYRKNEKLMKELPFPKELTFFSDSLN